MQGATAAAMLPLLSTSPEAAVADQFEERPGFGGTGALRSDMGPSVLGDGVEILITDMSYKELDKCPPERATPGRELRREFGNLRTLAASPYTFL